MSITPDPITQQEIEDLFLHSDPVPANTYELALVLGGTVSAGAYTAGALDFLFEALDAWTDAQQAKDALAPKHKLSLRFITGTSGGGVNAAIAARALACDFPHVVRATPDLAGRNPFYEVWVKRLDLHAMLGTDDLQSGPLAALLSGSCIDNGAAYIETYPQPALNLQGKNRSYLADPLRVILTLTNLRGLPYTTSFAGGQGGNAGQTFVDHADHARFAVRYPAQSFAAPRPDEWSLGFDQARLPQQLPWSEFSKFARATAAFPIGLPPRALIRPLAHYRYRVAAVPGDGAVPAQALPLVPDWDAIAAPDGGGDYHFLSVDGGVTDNEPIELARTALSGLLGRNPRDGLKASRGVLLIDPFAGYAPTGAAAGEGLLALAGDTINTMIQQARYDSRDILLATMPEVYSRFMIRAERGDAVGDKALATAGLGAFIGFASSAFRRHDYLLGRANCQAYLRTQFVLPQENPVFAGAWTQKQIARYGVTDAAGKVLLPLIPLMGDAAIPETLDPWPKGALKPEDFRDAIEERFKGVVAKAGPDFLGSFVTWLVEHVGDGKAADFVIEKMNQALDDWKLR
jgi:hypothetical protein